MSAVDLSGVDLPPSHPLAFALEGADLVFPPKAGARLWAFGRCPDLADLVGWTLVALVGGPQVSFVGFHPDLRFEDSPCVRFFTVTSLPPAVVGIVDALREIDLLVVDAEGRIAENFRFTAIRRSSLSPPSRPQQAEQRP